MKFELSDMLEAGKENPPPLRYSVEDILRQIHDANVEHWAPA